MKVQVARSSPTLWDPMDYTVHGILRARILEWVAFPFSRGSSQPRDRTQVSHIISFLKIGKESFWKAWQDLHPNQFHSLMSVFVGKPGTLVCSLNKEDLCVPLWSTFKSQRKVILNLRLQYSTYLSSVKAEQRYKNLPLTHSFWENYYRMYFRDKKEDNVRSRKIRDWTEDCEEKVLSQKSMSALENS